jgi:hypothetical protein
MVGFWHSDLFADIWGAAWHILSGAAEFPGAPTPTPSLQAGRESRVTVRHSLRVIVTQTSPFRE